MATTTNFGWETPDNTDLVKDGALAIRTLGSAIDTSLVDLKGGTTGQVLTKASNTDMDFSWTAVDPLVILDAKGDLISATAADTPARLAVGTNGQVLTADSTESTGLKWATPTSGGMTLISTTTLSAATSISLTSIPTTYKHLRLVFIDCLQSASDVFWSVRFNNDSGSNYMFTASAITSQPATQATTSDSATSIGTNKYIAPIPTTFTSANNGTHSGYFDVYNYASTTLKRTFFYVSNGYSQADNRYQNATGLGNYHSTGTAIDRIDLIRSSTQTITGTLQLWGIS